ncbi:MAG: nucleotidyltransferase domain-containing protein [Magnetococcales bacterium]|nr:nucleotidyltransferase domain-containing protein [Magnetococcales bacterium]
MDKVWQAWQALTGDAPETPLLNQEALITRIKATLPGLLAIYALGDRIEKGSGTIGGPLELAILMETEADPVALWSLARELAQITDCRVDLLDLRVSSTLTQYQVITTAERWWVSNPQAGLFECFVLSEKTALEESRAGVCLGM